MEYRVIQYVDKPISKIVFGCANSMMMTRPKIFKWKNVFDLLDAAFAAGINTFDTAENYGDSEYILGKWIKKRKIRDKIVIITKGCHPHGMPRVTPEALREDLEQSFRRLQTDYIDIYMLHRDCPEADIKAIVEVLNEYHKAGKIGAFGGSNWSHNRIAEVNRYTEEHDLVPFTVSSPNFGPAAQIEDPWGGGCISISGSANEDARRWYEDNGVPVFAYSCLGRGMFSGKVKTTDLESGKKMLDKFAIKGYWCPENIERLGRMEEIAKRRNCSMAQIALAYIMQQKFEAFPIATISNIDRIAENISAVNIELTEEEMALIAR